MITVKIAPVISRLFFLFVFIYSIAHLPARGFEMFNVYVSYADILLLTFFIFLIPLYFKKTESTISADSSIKLLYFIACYAFISTLWSSYSGSYWYIFYQVALTFITIAIPHLVSKITNDKYIDYHKLISNFSLLLTLVFLIYMIRISAESRFGGPLASAAIIGAALILTLSVHLYNILSKKRVFLSTIGLLICVLSVFLTQSRVAIIMLSLFLFVTLLRKPTIVRISVVALLTTLFILIFAQNVSLDRVQQMGFKDESRSIMQDSAISWWTDSTSSIIFGNGYGEIWQWAAYQVGLTSEWWGSWQYTKHGPVMYHAHSIFNQLLAELGLIGTIPFILLVLILFKETYKSWRVKNELKTMIFTALICTLLTFVTDLMIFRNWEVSIVWLFFLFTALKYIPKDANYTTIEQKKTA